MNASQPEIVATQRAAGSADVTVRAQILNIYRGTCEQHNRPVRFDHRADLGPQALIPCPDGDHEIPGRRLVCVASNVTCDGSCWSAVSDRCICGCGGANHGRAWMIAAASLADSQVLAEAWRGASLGRREVFEDELARWRAARVKSAQATVQRRERQAATRQRKAKVTFDEWAAGHGDVIEALRPWLRSSENAFLAQLAMQVTEGWNGTPKPISDAQVDAVRRTLEGREHRARQLAEREAAKRPAPTGRATITGRVVKVSWRSHDRNGDLLRWGPEHRMTVSCDGYAVQVAVPAAVRAWARENRREQLWRDRPLREDEDYLIGERWTDALKGLQVTLTTTVSRSRNETTFGFGKGASGVRITEPDREAEAG